MGFHTFNLIAHSLEASDLINQNTSNSFKVMVVLEAQEDKDLLDGLLNKILAAIKIDLTEDVCLIKTPEPSHKLNILKSIKDLKIKKVLCFGLQPKDLTLNFSTTLYKPMQVGDMTFLFADALSTLDKEPDRKKALWNNLQEIFLSK